MNKVIASLIVLAMTVCLTGCSSSESSPNPSSQDNPAASSREPAISAQEQESSDSSSFGEIEISIEINGSVFVAQLYDNDAAHAFAELLPLNINMADLNHNEKFYNLDKSLPNSTTESPQTIYAGELMCWSGNCLVLFYETFPNSYGGYVRLGAIEDTTNLAEALGTENVDVSIYIFG